MHFKPVAACPIAHETLTQERNLHEAEGEIPEEDQPNSSASAMLDFAEGRIAILPEERADSDEA